MNPSKIVRDILSRGLNRDQEDLLLDWALEPSMGVATSQGDCAVIAVTHPGKVRENGKPKQNELPVDAPRKGSAGDSFHRGEFDDRLRQLVEEGEKSWVIADLLGVSDYQVQKRIDRLNLNYHRSVRKMGRDDVLEIMRLHNSGMKNQKISVATRFSPATVSMVVSGKHHFANQVLKAEGK